MPTRPRLRASAPVTTVVLVGAVAVVLVAAGLVALGVVPTGHGGTSTEKPSRAYTASSRSRCSGLDHRDVRGLDPTYTRKRLADFPNHKLLCHGIWLPEPRRYFIPQGLAVRGRTAWISGFRYRPTFGSRQCQLMRVDLVTGRRLAFHTSVVGRVGQRPTTYCRHGGGLLQRGKWLWIAEKGKLWLVDSTSRRASLRATRVWRVHSPVRGSSLVATRDRIGLVPFTTRGRPHLYWFSLRGLLQRGTTDLVVRRHSRGEVGALAATRVPRLTQGATVDRFGRLYLSRSNLSCAELVTPFGRRMAIVPGAEGMAFAARGRRLWIVSESGARPYAISHKPLTPAVSSFEFPRLLRGKRETCPFPAY